MEKDAVLRISVNSNHGGTYPTQTDTLEVKDYMFLDGKIPVQVLPETEYLDEGCYEFLIYGDSLGVSQEYVKNFVLTTQRYNDYYFALNFTEPGRISLCITKIPMPTIQRFVDLPAVEGVATIPVANRYYVKGHENFTFKAYFTGSPMKVGAIGYYSGTDLNLDETSTTVPVGDSDYKYGFEYYIIRMTEPWTVYIGPGTRSDVGTDYIDGNKRLWVHKNTLYINALKEDVVSIHNMTGVLYKKVEIPEGLSKFTLEKGLYVITFKDGSVEKIIVK
jgi:hypothetical protein